MSLVQEHAQSLRRPQPVQPHLRSLRQGRLARLGLLPLVLRGGFQTPAGRGARADKLPGPLPALRWKADAFYALLPLVQSENTKAVDGLAVPGDVRWVRLVGGFELLELLPVVHPKTDRISSGPAI